ncbi:mandelate racemase [Sulfolobus sp. A20]|uniref:enolase C-terminal domain-like protein n=1 Tax=Saccharolobus sp. A20 TaxID=1891280 RepID=UPI000846144D|nr:enolase C-terminal domain-like protein [Sulfolobus sp. A20]AOL16527.1 mandelate racemase [Sulfolobus sp. A20]TRM74853.1 mandelate racemase [Sulfolobus sp. A20-N-F8]TRM86315.1 mandelate racemase [Sulfolobus sp. C3]TRN04089.1 mandelate racemase [Sulfolobus sp. F1]
MKITKVEAKSISLPLKRRLLRVAGEHPGTTVFTLVKISTDEGIVGYGETGGGGYSLVPLIDKLKDLLIGEDPFNIRRLRYKVAAPITTTYYNQLLPQIWFPIETALLDIKGKALGLPLHDLLGGKVRDEVETSGYIFATPETISVDDLVKMVKNIVKEYGFRVIKLKAGVFKPEHEIDAIKTMATEIPKVKFRVDPNGGWNLSEALSVSRSLEGANIEYFEDPVWTCEGLRAFKEASKFPVATNTVATRFEDIQNVYTKRCVDIVLGDPHWWFGVYGYLELSATLWALGLELGMHSPSETGISLSAMVQVASSTFNLSYAIDTHYIHLAGDIIKRPLKIENGKIKVPNDPGLGIEVDENKVDRFETLYKESGEYVYHLSKDSKSIPTIPKTDFMKCDCH